MGPSQSAFNKRIKKKRKKRSGKANKKKKKRTFYERTIACRVSEKAVLHPWL